VAFQVSGDDPGAQRLPGIIQYLQDEAFFSLDLLCFNTYHSYVLTIEILGGRKPFAYYIDGW
jgi:hypothetical protein